MVVGVTAERLLTLWGTVSPSTSVSVAVGRHRCPPYCRHNVSSYFTDKLTLIGNFLDLQQRLARLRDVCTVYTLFGSAVVFIGWYAVFDEFSPLAVCADVEKHRVDEKDVDEISFLADVLLVDQVEQ
ncbi:hypothetical protein T08_9827 [Trichinella sp. T8]|uniref:Transmembrane protein n=1 Tax=Trichinella murrelli TaxID=144512 RepID=A0A0V0TVM0_9BILA|nr:hypothetical protein T05_8017 [Trichinella murrelli]KRZ89064.1 hypothetical protein T08_9827 [Trichinella sp. T8]